MAGLWAFLRRVSTRFTLHWAVVLCLVFQPIYGLIFSLPVHAEVVEPGSSEQENPAPTDTTPPAVPISGVPHNTIKATADFSFTWQSSVELGVKYELRISRDQTQVGQAADTSNAWYSPRVVEPTLAASSVSDFADGVWYWQVRALDTAGNKSGWSDVWNVKVDTVGPGITVLQPAEAGIFGGPSSTPIGCDIRIHESELAAFGLELDGINIISQAQTIPDENGLHLTISWNPKILGDGSHKLRVWAKDAAGHIQEVTRTFTVDMTAPEITTSITEHQKLKGLVALDLNANEVHPGSYHIDIASADGVIITQAEVQEADVTAQSINTLTRTWNTLDVADGAYQIRFVGRDSLGNETVVVRNVVVANSVASIGVIAKDPLLEQLSASLNQPFISPQIGASQSQLLTGAIPNIGDIESQKYDELLENVPQFTAVAATENGWQLFGILWYWWVLGGFLLTAGGVYSWRTVKPGSERKQMLDSA